MCGIFGASFQSTAFPDEPVPQAAIENLIEDLFLASEARGKEASGLAWSGSATLQVFRRAGAAHKMVRRADYRAFLANALCDQHSGGFEFVGHSRLVTNGVESEASNNQPVASDRAVCVHNGIIVNDAELTAAHRLTRKSEVDTEVLLRLVDRFLDEGTELEEAVRRAYSEIEGSASVMLLSRDEPGILVATNTGSLFRYRGSRAQVFASEPSFLESIVHRPRNQALLGPGAVEQVEAGQMAWLPRAQAGQAVTEWVTSLEMKAPRLQAVGTGGSVSSFASIRPQNETRGAIRKILSEDNRRQLRRCTRCVLPQTFPFIEFDSDGVCNLCRKWKPFVPAGRKALDELVEGYRKKHGNTCIVAFSGGRDSSYGLHYLKKELGLNPIAFTYDWGMVTDLARRNQARICGDLGIEHVVRAADIPAKRRYIRMNIEAWLKRPHLGLIPLFMAGDKMFYHYARTLRRERRIPLLFFCGGNPYEQTDFKTGFCGVKENDHGNQLTRLGLGSKLQSFAFYASQFLRNPRYFNRSLPDTMWAFYNFYVARDDFPYLFHFIQWDEAEIERVLLNEYGWETATDTKTTWRIGDGTAAFYNYIYYTVAGFTEHDTFRSHQIRAGILTRDEGLRLVERDNRPRRESIQEYAELVGFNCNEVLNRINEIPKLW